MPHQGQLAAAGQVCPYGRVAGPMGKQMDDASPALLLQVWNDFPGDADGVQERGVQRGHQRLIVELGNGAGGHVGHVGDQYSDLAEAVERIPDHAADVPGH